MVDLFNAMFNVISGCIPPVIPVLQGWGSTQEQATKVCCAEVKASIYFSSSAHNAGRQVLPLYVVSRCFSWETSTRGSVFLVHHCRWFFGVLCSGQNVCFIIPFIVTLIVCLFYVIGMQKQCWLVLSRAHEWRCFRKCMWMDDEKLKNINKLGPLNISACRHRNLIRSWYPSHLLLN